MARKKSIDRHELMRATEKLLVETGYDGFHFRLLAEKLGVGRSTIYEYYANKDDLIIAYIHSFAYERVKESKEIMILEDIQEQFKAFLRIYLKYNHIQQLVNMIIHMENQQKPQNQEDIKQIKLLIKEINQVSLKLIQKGKETGKIRKDIDDLFISYAIFNLVQIPNFQKQEEEERLNNLVNFIFHGVSV